MNTSVVLAPSASWRKELQVPGWMTQDFLLAYFPPLSNAKVVAAKS